MKTLLLISILLVSVCLAADPTPSPLAGAGAGDPRRLEKVYVDYIASLDAIVAKKPERREDIGGKIAATKYCLSALRKEFGLPNKE
jgi:hypothetical protein